MRVKRPASATAAGVLCIIFGSIFTLCNLCGVISVAMQGAGGGNPFVGADPIQQQIQVELQREMEKLPAYTAVSIMSVTVGLTQAVVMLICGIGILSLRSWARTLALVFSFIGIFFVLAQTIYQLAVVMPGIRSAFRAIVPRLNVLPPNAIQAIESFMTFVSITTVFFYALEVIYLAIVLALLFRSNVREAFADAAMGGAYVSDREPRERRRYRYEEDEPEEDYRHPPDDSPRDDWRIRS